MRARISFVGAGPGAADLITVRGSRRIAEADVVVWTASLVAPECIREHARSDAELIDSSRLSHEEAVEIYRRAERDRLNVARVHAGDPSVWGAVQEQYDACARMDVDVEIVPGVAVFSAAAAAVGKELTTSEAAQSVVLARLEGGKAPVAESERVREFAKHGTTMALFVAAARTEQLVEELRAGGYDDDVPVLIGYKVTWPDELLLRTTLGELEKTVKQHKLWRHTLFVVGRAVGDGATRPRSHTTGYFSAYRRGDALGRRVSRAEKHTGRRGRSGAPRPEGESAGEPDTDPQASTDSVPAVDSVPRPRAVVRPPGQPDPDVAWSAVHNWQETARGAARVAAARASTGRRAASADSAQSELFVDIERADEPVEASESVDSEGKNDTDEVAFADPQAPASDAADVTAPASASETPAETTNAERTGSNPTGTKRRTTAAAGKATGKSTSAKTRTPAKSARSKSKSGTRTSSTTRKSSPEQGNAHEQG